jgi:nucleoid-associated protein EbfC
MEGNDMGMSKLLKQAQKMQEKMQRELSETITEATVGGGTVHAKMNGHKQLLAIRIAPEAIDREDIDGLQALVLAAVNQVTRQMDEILRRKLGPAATSMPSLF